MTWHQTVPTLTMVQHQTVPTLTMVQHQTVPTYCKQQPGNEEGGGEAEEGEGPGHVDHGYEEIFQVPAAGQCQQNG